MSVLDFDPSSISMPAGFMHNFVVGFMVVLWGAIIIGVFYFVFRWMSYRIHVELFAKEGRTVVQTGYTRAREISSIKGSEYELRTSLFKPFTKKEWFRIDNPQHRIPSRKGVIFKLIRAGFNDYHPMPITNPDVKLEIMPQNNISWYTRKGREIVKKFAKPSIWSHPAIIPITWVTCGVIFLIAIMLTLDKAGEITGHCESAKDTIVNAVSQKLK